MPVHTVCPTKYPVPHNGNWLNIDGTHIPRSVSPEPLDVIDDDPTRPPGLSSSISSNGDTRSSSSSSVSTTAGGPTEPSSSTEKKKGRLHNMFHHAGLHIRSGLRMTPMMPSNNNTSPPSSLPDNDHESFASAKSRRSSVASSLHSYGSSVSGTWNRLVNSSPWKHNHHSTSPSSSSSLSGTRLTEKYGNYINRSHNNKGMGSTSKKNIASGATAVIRLVQDRHTERILAVKEFKKRDKTEPERDYLKRMQNEYCISKTVSGHPNVVETIDLIRDEHDRWCTVMEYVSHGNIAYERQT